MTENENWFPTEKNIEEYKLLKDMPSSQRIEYDLLSKKKVDGQLNSMKIKMVNRVLEPLKEICKHEESYEFLDVLNEDEMPTYSDVVLIISQFKTAISEFKSKYKIRDEFQSAYRGYTVTRWMTQEFPPNYYEHEEEDEDEDV